MANGWFHFGEWLHVNESTAAAGLLGGTVRGLLIRGGLVNGMISAFVGCVTASYLAPELALSSLNQWMFTEGTIGFLVGMTGMLICEGILKYVKDKISTIKLPEVKQ